jgi:hypothetical protein
MASRSLGTLTVDLIAKTGGFTAGMTEAERATAKAQAKMKRDMREMAAEIDKWGTRFAAAGAAAAVGLIYMSARAAEAIDKQADLAAQLNTTFDSLSTLSLAAKNAGFDMDLVGGAVKKLNDSIGNLSSGAGGAGADALARLGLTAQQLSAMNADQKISTINTRIAEMVPAAEQASIAVDLFGKAAGAAILQLDEGRMAAAAEQARVFGLNLSEIDAARIGQIGDAFDTVGAAVQGLGGQIANEFAPIINQIGIEFFGAAKEAGGFGVVAKKIFDAVIGGIAKVISAFDFLGRPAEAFRATMTAIASTVALAFKGLALAIAKALDIIPGIDMSATIDELNMEIDQSAKMAEIAAGRIGDAFTRPLDGDKFREWVKNAEESSIKAAEAAAAAAEEARKKAAKDAGLAAAEEQRKKAEEEAKRAMDAGAKIKAAEDKAREDKLNALRDQYKSETQLLGEKYVEEQLLLQEKLAMDKSFQDEYDALSLESKIAYEEAIGQIESDEEKRKKDEREKGFKEKIAGTQSALGSISTLMNSENRKMFEIGKVAAIANAIISTSQGIMEAWKLGPILGPILAPLVAVAGAAQIANIKATKFGGGGSAPSAGVSKTGALNAANTPVGGLGQGGGGRNVFVHGIDPNSLFSGKQMVELINGAVADGATLRLANV